MKAQCTIALEGSNGRVRMVYCERRVGILEAGKFLYDNYSQIDDSAREILMGLRTEANVEQPATKAIKEFHSLQAYFKATDLHREFNYLCSSCRIWWVNYPGVEAYVSKDVWQWDLLRNAIQRAEFEQNKGTK